MNNENHLPVEDRIDYESWKVGRKHYKGSIHVPRAFTTSLASSSTLHAFIVLGYSPIWVDREPYVSSPSVFIANVV